MQSIRMIRPGARPVLPHLPGQAQAPTPAPGVGAASAAAPAATPLPAPAQASPAEPVARNGQGGAPAAAAAPATPPVPASAQGEPRARALPRALPRPEADAAPAAASAASNGAGAASGSPSLRVLLADSVASDPRVRQQGRQALREHAVTHFSAILREEGFQQELRLTLGIAGGVEGEALERKAEEMTKASLLDMTDISRTNIEDFLSASEQTVRNAVLKYAALYLTPSRAAKMGTFVPQKSGQVMTLDARPELAGLISSVRRIFNGLGEPTPGFEIGVIYKADLPSFSYTPSLPAAEALTHESQMVVKGTGASDENPIVGAWARVTSKKNPALDRVVVMDLAQIRDRISETRTNPNRDFGKNNYYKNNPKAEFTNPVLRELCRATIFFHGRGQPDLSETETFAESEERPTGLAAAAVPVEPTAEGLADALTPVQAGGGARR